MSEPKTRKNRGSVTKFLAAVENDRRRQDATVVCQLMEEVTGEKPSMWGDSIVGFGSYTQHYASGRKGEWFLTGFSPRKQSLTLYIMSGFKAHARRLTKLGKHKTGRSCLYINKLEDVDEDVLRKLVEESVEKLSSR